MLLWLLKALSFFQFDEGGIDTGSPDAATAAVQPNGQGPAGAYGEGAADPQEPQLYDLGDGIQATRDDILEWQKSHQNKSNWQDSLGGRENEVADLRKTYESTLERLNPLLEHLENGKFGQPEEPDPYEGIDPEDATLMQHAFNHASAELRKEIAPALEFIDQQRQQAQQEQESKWIEGVQEEIQKVAPEFDVDPVKLTFAWLNDMKSDPRLLAAQLRESARNNPTLPFTQPAATPTPANSAIGEHVGGPPASSVMGDTPIPLEDKKGIAAKAKSVIEQMLRH